MSFLAPAASALVLHGTRILFVRSVRTKQQWAFPGGKSENGETAGETAVREVMEEVGLRIELRQELGQYVTKSSGFQITCFVATARTAALEVDADEILEARWCSLDESLQLDLIPSVREALQEFSRLPGH